MQVWNGEIHQDVIIRVVSSPLAIVLHLGQVLAIHLAIPLLGINVILIQWSRVPVVNGRYKGNANY